MATYGEMPKEGIFLDRHEISMERLESILHARYWLSNYQPGRLTVFSPQPYGGGVGYVYGESADRLGAIHDPWNFGIWRERLKVQPTLRGT